MSALVNLEQFRAPVQAWKDKVLLPLSYSDHDAERHAEADRLLSIIDNAGKVECATCGGRGEVGGHTGQTPEQFEYVTEPCPECQGDVYGSADAPTPLGRMLGVQPAPVVDDAMRELIEASYAVWYDTLGATTGGKSERLRAALARAQGVQS